MAKCSECGFLSKYCPGIHIPTPNFFEMDIHARTTGKAFQHTVTQLSGPRESYPVCFRQVPEFENTFDVFKNPGGQQDPRVLLPLLQQERSCSLWCEYVPGLDPKEHFAFMKFQELELKRQQFEQRIADDHKALVLQMDTANKTFLK